ncbi:MAG: transposase [Rhizomicrobium sp.]
MELSRGDLNEAEWRLHDPLLPPERGRKSRTAFDNRQIVNGIWWRIRTGAPLRDLPDKHGKWITVYQLFRRWGQVVIWERGAVTLPESMANNGHHSVDSTTVRTHVSATGAKKGRVNKLLEGLGSGFDFKGHCLSDTVGLHLPSTSRRTKLQTAPYSKTSSRSPR